MNYPQWYVNNFEVIRAICYITTVYLLLYALYRVIRVYKPEWAARIEAYAKQKDDEE